MVDKIESEVTWAQQIVDKWAKEMLMTNAPRVWIIEEEYVTDQDENDEDDKLLKNAPAATYGGGYIGINKHFWLSKETLFKLWILGHEFIHWLQDIRSSDTKESAVEREAYKLGLELARRQIAQWRRRPKLPLQLELPLE